MKLLNVLQTASQLLTSYTDEALCSLKQIIWQGFSILLRLLAPIVPHITHALWKELKFCGLIDKAAWPKVAADALTVDTHYDDKTLKTLILNDPQIKRYIENQTIKKMIIVPKKLINIVI